MLRIAFVDKLLLNLSWRLSKENPDRYIPGFVFQSLEPPYSLEFQPLKPGNSFSFRISDQRRCIGYEAKRGEWKPCPYENVPLEGSLQCYKCASNDFFNCRMTCTGTVCSPSSREALELCSTPDTYVYVTHVGGSIKVGVSLSPTKRWLDQGSLFGARVFRSWGLEARRIERELAAMLEAKLAVRNSTKITQLASGKIGLAKAQEELREALRRTEKFKPSVRHFREIAKIENLAQYYGKIFDLDQAPSEANLSLNREVGGIIEGVIGKLVVFKNKKSVFVLDSKKILGHIITALSSINEMKGQRSLMDFF